MTNHVYSLTEKKWIEMPVQNYVYPPKPDQEAIDKKAELKRVAIEELKKKYPNLQQRTGEKYSKEDKPRLIATKNIRTELKESFPHIKFSITSKVFSGGDDISVKWSDGPTVDEVEKIVGKYNEGHFDGMTDCYNYSEGNFNDLFGGAKYVLTQRDVSKEKYIEVAESLGYHITITDRWEFIGCDYQTRDMLQRKIYETSF